MNHEAFDLATVLRARTGAAGGLRADRGCTTLLRTGASLAAVLVLTCGCGSSGNWTGPLTPYRPDVQQGNIVTQEMTTNLHPGLTRDQVRFMLGTPLLTSVFHPDRWDYVYYLKRRDGEVQRRHLAVVFKNNRVEWISHDTMPPESVADNLILGRKPKPAPTPPPREPAPLVEIPTTPANPPPTTSAPPPTPAPTGSP